MCCQVHLSFLFLLLLLFLLLVDAIDIPLLRQQQIRLGLLKAARVLFSQQENLRQIMARPANTEGDQYSLFQQLLSAATRPSPIKAMFSRDELEVTLLLAGFYLQWLAPNTLVDNTTCIFLSIFSYIIYIQSGNETATFFLFSD